MAALTAQLKLDYDTILAQKLAKAEAEFAEKLDVRESVARAEAHDAAHEAAKRSGSAGVAR